MSDHAFRALINLVRFDQDINKVKTVITSLQEEIAQLIGQEQQLLQELEDAKQQVLEWRKKVDEQELEMKALDDKEKEAVQRLDAAASQKEYNALKAEIDHLKQAQHNLEQEVMLAWNKLELAEKEFKSKQAMVQEQLEKVRIDYEQKKQKVADLKSDLTKRNQQRLEKEQQVPEEWLEKYTAMGSRVTNPVVPALHGSCSACFFMITSQDMLRLKRGALLQCKGCFRFLYDPEVMEFSVEVEEPKKLEQEAEEQKEASHKGSE